MSTNYSLLFYLKKPKNYVSGPKPIYMRITVDGIPKEVSTGRECDPSKWNSKANRVKGTTEAVKTLNSYLEEIADLCEITKELTEGSEITTAIENSFYPSHNRAGTYRADILHGSVVKALVISFDLQWTAKIVRSYRVLWEAIREIADSDREFSIIPWCRVDRIVERELAEILDFHDDNIGIVKLKLPYL
ncbi:MAG: recombinase [Sphingobacterium sp.]|jgi:hypothetical protein|nr:recombinase [Sphingobacterium sp.]